MAFSLLHSNFCCLKHFPISEFLHFAVPTACNILPQYPHSPSPSLPSLSQLKGHLLQQATPAHPPWISPQSLFLSRHPVVVSPFHLQLLMICLLVSCLSFLTEVSAPRGTSRSTLPTAVLPPPSIQHGMTKERSSDLLSHAGIGTFKESFR